VSAADFPSAVLCAASGFISAFTDVLIARTPMNSGCGISVFAQSNFSARLRASSMLINLTVWPAKLRPSVALEILLEGRVFGAREAFTKGLVHRVVPDLEVEGETYASAARIAAGAPLVARWHKRFIRRLAGKTRLSDAEWQEGFACFDTEDYREGLRAFLAKVPPQFKGR
jgi:hypothetical protein